MARPSIPPEQRRIVQTTVHLSIAEADRLYRAARKARQSVSEFLRSDPRWNLLIHPNAITLAMAPLFPATHKPKTGNAALDLERKA